MSRVGVIDCGTNTVRLLIAERGRDIFRDLKIVRLGAGVDGSGRLADEAMERAASAIANYVERAKSESCDRVAIFATSAVRDAANREVFIADIAARTGIAVDVIPGDREAQLAFAGATAELAPGEKVVCDIGGGSTELVLGEEHPREWVSLQLGSVRMTERHADDSPGGVALDAMRNETRFIIEQGWSRQAPRAAFVGVAGTVTTLAAIALGLETYDPALVHGSVLPYATIVAMTERLALLPPAGRLERYPVIQAGREDVLVAGAVILASAMERLGADACIVSERDILDGMAASVMGRQVS